MFALTLILVVLFWGWFMYCQSDPQLLRYFVFCWLHVTHLTFNQISFLRTYNSGWRLQLRLLKCFNLIWSHFTALTTRIIRMLVTVLATLWDWAFRWTQFTTIAMYYYEGERKRKKDHSTGQMGRHYLMLAELPTNWKADKMQVVTFLFNFICFYISMHI